MLSLLSMAGCITRLSVLDVVALLALFLFSPTVHGGLVQTYCSSQNTSPNKAETWLYQSNGHCREQCGGYAFGIVQGENCWCSDYAPAARVDLSQCNRACPGYPDEKCGQPSSNLFGYLALDKDPSGTVGSSPSSTSEPSSTPPQTTSMTSYSSTSTPTLIISLKTVTIPGGVMSVSTVTTTPTVAPVPSQHGDGGPGPGPIAGAVVGSVGGVALVAGLVYFWLARWRRRRQLDSDGIPVEGSTPRRNTSTLSRTGLLKTEKQIHPPALAVTRSSSNNLGMESSNPASERRHSNIRLFDQRLNLSLLMDLDNGSRASVATMQDNRDYNRVLEIRNPDPADLDGASSIHRT